MELFHLLFKISFNWSIWKPSSFFIATNSLSRFVHLISPIAASFSQICIILHHPPHKHTAYPLLAGLDKHFIIVQIWGFFVENVQWIVSSCPTFNVKRKIKKCKLTFPIFSYLYIGLWPSDLHNYCVYTPLSHPPSNSFKRMLLAATLL